MPGKRGGGSPGVFSKKGLGSSGSSTSHSKPAPAPTQQAASHSTAKPTSSPAPSKPTPTSTPSSATTPQMKQTPTATPATPQPTASPMSGSGGSLLGNIATTAAGSMVGVMGAHAVMGLFKGDEKEAPQQQQQQNMQAQPAQGQLYQSEMNGPCAVQFQGFQKCLDNNSNSVSSCQWAYDLFNQCKVQKEEQHM